MSALDALDRAIEAVNDILMREYPGLKTNEDRRDVAAEIVFKVRDELVDAIRAANGN